MTAYATGQPTPVAAIAVESPQGALASNTGIVSAGSNGSIDVYASDPTDLVVDISGYYVSFAFAFPNLNAMESNDVANSSLPDSMLLNELQKEHKQVEEQAETIRVLEARLAVLEKALLSGR